MKIIAGLLVIGLVGCSTAPYHGAYTRGGVEADYKADRDQCREVAKKKATDESYGHSWSESWWMLVEKHTLACMNDKGYEWVKKE